MKILLITNLYPYTKDIYKDNSTKALYNLTKLWSEDVDVIRPIFLPSDYKSINVKLNEFGKIRIGNNNIHVLPIWKVPKTNIYFYNKLIKYVEKNDINPDVIISHRLHCAIGAAKLARKINKPLIIGLHNSDILQLRFNDRKTDYKIILEQAVAIACRSQSILNEVIQLYPEYSCKCFIAFSGIEEKIINPIDKTLEKLKEWTKKDRPIRFITAARLKKLKNIDINLKALAKLDNNIDWEYFIIGAGSELNNLKSLTEELGISRKVIFLGEKDRKEVLEYMEKSDVFIMVSAPETFGLSYIEAMAKGCIVIGAFNNGIDGVVEDGDNGFLCTPRSINDLACKIEKIINLNYSTLTQILFSTNETIKKYTEENASREYFKTIKELSKVLKKF